MDIDARAKPLTLVACILGSAIIFVDQTVVNVALPALSDDLDATLAGQQPSRLSARKRTSPIVSYRGSIRGGGQPEALNLL